MFRWPKGCLYPTTVTRIKRSRWLSACTKGHLLIVPVISGFEYVLIRFHRYTEPFATKLAKHLYKLCNPSTRIAFICCPTAFVGFQHTNPLPGARLLEYDQRFSFLAPSQFIPYDINHPDKVPEQLIHSFDIIVADPPFLNLETNEKLAVTVDKVLKPDGKLMMITSPSVEEVLEKVFAVPPVGPLKRTRLEVKHGQLANACACWGSWDGAEDFGSE